MTEARRKVRQHDEPTASAMWLFAHVFGEDADGFLVTFTGRQARLENPDARPNELVRTMQRSWRFPHAAKAAADYLIREAQRGRDAYYSTHLYREAGNRRSSNAVGALACCWLDEDGGCYPEDGPEPTAIVSSSEGRRHLYWRLAHLLSAEWVVEMNRRIATWSGGDIGKAGLSSVLRVPGTTNFKRYPKVDPVRLEVTDVEAWEPEVMEQAIPPLPEPETEPRCEGTYDGPEIEIADYLSKVEVLYETPDELSGVKWAIVCPWVSEHSGADRSGTYIGKRIGGGPWFVCRHNHCYGRNWFDFKNKVCPRARKSKSKARRVWKRSLA